MENASTGGGQPRSPHHRRPAGAPAHVIGWAPQDWLTARIRTRTLMSGDLALRCIYFELLNVLYANGGSLSNDHTELAHLLMVPEDEIARCVPLLVDYGYIEVEDGHLTNRRVTSELEAVVERRERAVEYGRRGSAFGRLGGRPRKAQETPTPFSENPLPETENPRRKGREGKGREGKGRIGENVYAYWQEQTGTTIRSEKVEQSILKRIAARLTEGFSEEDLKRCVDVARYDPFYVERGYAKQPDVIWRNAERVQSLLAKIDHARARPLPL